MNRRCFSSGLLPLTFTHESKVPDPGGRLSPSPPSTCPGVESGKPTHFTVVTKGAGKAPLDVSFSSPVRDFDIIDNYDYSQTVKYTPAQQVTGPTAPELMLSVSKMLDSWCPAPSSVKELPVRLEELQKLTLVLMKSRGSSLCSRLAAPRLDYDTSPDLN